MPFMKFVFLISLFAVPCTYCRPCKLGLAAMRSTANPEIRNTNFTIKGNNKKLKLRLPTFKIKCNGFKKLLKKLVDINLANTVFYSTLITFVYVVIIFVHKKMFSCHS